MMGRSNRFFQDGYTQPKYELPLAGKTVFDWVLTSFSQYFRHETFLFVVREDFNAEPFVRQTVEKLGIQSFEILILPGNTLGQADTVAQALRLTSLESPNSDTLSIFNADSFIIDFVLPDKNTAGDGLLEVFPGEGDHWSFIRPSSGNLVAETAEKKRISNLCSNGYYYFRTTSIFLEGYDQMRRMEDTVNGEFYIAPLYNHLIRLGHEITYRVRPIEKSIFCGIPAEYEELKAQDWKGF